MKPIQVTKEQQKQLLEDFQKLLLQTKSSSGKIKIELDLKDLQKDIKKPTVYFTPEAWLKMRQLITNTTSEIGWHGLVERNDLDEFLIYDIIVYPQTVTGVTVTADQIEYQNWLMKQNDQDFKRIRFQGHSHVNMSVSPSGVDTALYEGILQNLKKDDFYIFMIGNKRNDINIWIHDMSQNVIFEDNDITIEILIGFGEDGYTVSDWAKDAKDVYVTEAKTLAETKEVNYEKYFSTEGYEHYMTQSQLEKRHNSSKNRRYKA